MDSGLQLFWPGLVWVGLPHVQAPEWQEMFSGREVKGYLREWFLWKVVSSSASSWTLLTLLEGELF